MEKELDRLGEEGVLERFQVVIERPHIVAVQKKDGR